MVGLKMKPGPIIYIVAIHFRTFLEISDCFDNQRIAGIPTGGKESFLWLNSLCAKEIPFFRLSCTIFEKKAAQGLYVLPCHHCCTAKTTKRHNLESFTTQGSPGLEMLSHAKHMENG